MITITPSLDQLKRAKTLYDFGILDNSITQGDGSAAGAIAEICFFDYFLSIGKEIIHAKHYDYDFILTDKKIEVKAMRVNTIPKLMHHCNLSSHNYMQTNIAKHEKQRTRGDRIIISSDYSMPYATQVPLASHAYTQQNARHTSAALCLTTG